MSYEQAALTARLNVLRLSAWKFISKRLIGVNDIGASC